MSDQGTLLLSTKEAAQLLSVSPRTLWGWTASGDVPCVRKGRILRYDPEALRQWVLDHSVSGSGEYVNGNPRGSNGQYQRKRQT